MSRPQIALDHTLKIGTSFGAPTEGEVELAELITGILPSMEKVRLVSSGTLAELQKATGCTGLVEMFLRLANTGPVLQTFPNGEATA